MLFKEDTFDEFYTITGVDILNLFQKYLSFQKSDSQNIIDFYSGVSKANMNSFDKLNILLYEVTNALSLFYQNKEAFNSIADWNLLEQIDETRKNLETLSNINKYLRSSINKNQFNTNIEVSVKLKRFDTLESIEFNELNSTDPQNDWINLALYNQLREEDYTSKGNKLLKSLTSNFNITSLNSVVGNLQGENLYGKDFDRKIQFSVEDQDLKVLTPKETIKQAAEVLSNLNRGDNPEFPNNGIQKSLFVGNNLAGMSYPILFRQLLNNFSEDDTFSYIKISTIKTVKDSVEVEFEIQTKYGEKFNEIKTL